ncbi:MAG: DUF2975 domain-containing protein [Oscillospiraceae bacterium]|nr:DUF2975 domain-containing protein [Oscillospiraceae bacterium]
MSRNNIVTHITLWVSRLVAVLLVGLLPTFPMILRWYIGFRPLTPAGQTALTLAFYLCAIITAVALWQIDRLLRSILKEQVFTGKNVSCIRTIRWCCAGISLVCLPTAFFYLPLVFMVIIMAFLALVVTVLVRVMTAAVEIREENDLTI